MFGSSRAIWSTIEPWSVLKHKFTLVFNFVGTWIVQLEPAEVRGTVAEGLPVAEGGKRKNTCIFFFATDFA